MKKLLTLALAAVLALSLVACGGSGSVKKSKRVTVSIPAGIDDGQAISLRGQGNAGKNGGPAGDLIVAVHVKPHPQFRRDGTTVLLVEQNAKMALSISHRAYVLETGAISLEGAAADLLDNEQVRHAYLGG